MPAAKTPVKAKPAKTPRKQTAAPEETKTAAGEPLLPPENPGIEQIKDHIIRRVLQLIDTCTDPKKLMDTYEAISKLQQQEQQTSQPQQNLFDIISCQVK